ncbi:acetolactate synthase 2 small subunit [Candidatus Blochmannia ocreatus (nom. nud.)]|uniref:Acetolactate synthase 2 small subunit n=1 Tax=Candidatus Blochmannia ocreatus (nom. nud.) TaxID=251538 RepID=A0ABY4SYL1_9ENTR|nr:acetolactate synthase 2 small subunit [Candidatus Blochmannia ocreatus]URJ25062.1 acetolactate synthase 2 small subunit [Candidatus Blochmannia ocreatus]
MIYHSLSIKARFCPEVLERILRVIRHRRFELHTLYMSSYMNTNNRKNIHLIITVSSKKKIYILSEQLKKLIDIYYLKIQ